jgi:colicin import membrane protein
MVTKKHTPDDRIPAGKRNGSRGFFLFFTASFIGHLVVFALFVLLPDVAPAKAPAKKFAPSVISVSLVSIPSQGALPRSSSKATLKAPKQRFSTKVSPDSKKMVSVAPVKRKPKKSLKKKTFKSTKVIKQAISSLEKKVEDSRPPSLNEALDKLKRRVEETDPAERLRKEAVENLARKGSGCKYTMPKLSTKFKKTGCFPSNLPAVNHMDDSAYKALVKSNPLPPLPEEYTRPDYKIGFRFGPKGLK